MRPQQLPRLAGHLLQQRLACMARVSGPVRVEIVKT
jgi:hypothetical protein